MKIFKKILLFLPLFLLVMAGIFFLPLLFGTRPLSENEEETAGLIFGGSIDYEQVRIKNGGPLTWIYPGVTIGHIISFPRDNYDENSREDRALFLHEMTHVWQYEHIGLSYIPRALYEEIFQPDAYTVHYDAEKNFLDYDVEEQAEIVAEYYLTQKSEYEFYIQDFKAPGEVYFLYEDIHLNFNLNEIGTEPKFDLLIGRVSEMILTLNQDFVYIATAQGGGTASFIYDLEHKQAYFLGNEIRGLGRWLPDGRLEVVNKEEFGENIGAVTSIYRSVDSEEPWILEPQQISE
jgi:Domain of unknown function (DUF4157)